MPRMREVRLIIDGSVCEYAHAYKDPTISTSSQARAKGNQRCPLWEPCASRQLQNTDKMLCTALVGQVMARAVAEGSSIEAEVEELRASPFLEPGSYHYIDPYSESPTESAESDLEKGRLMITDWAKTILYGPGERLESSSADASLPDFLDLSRSALRGSGISLLAIEESASRTRSNGGIACDTSSGPCSCGAWH